MPSQDQIWQNVIFTSACEGEIGVWVKAVGGEKGSALNSWSQAQTHLIFWLIFLKRIVLFMPETSYLFDQVGNSNCTGYWTTLFCTPIEIYTI